MQKSEIFEKFVNKNAIKKFAPLPERKYFDPPESEKSYPPLLTTPPLPRYDIMPYQPFGDPSMLTMVSIHPYSLSLKHRE